MSRYRQAERLARYRKRRRAGYPVVVSEGDSWFSYEFYPNIIDLLDDEEKFAHLRLEMSGDTVENMATPEAIEDLRDIVIDHKALFLLFSGGGNDIQRKAEELFQSGTQPRDCIITQAFEDLFGGLRSSYERLIRAIGPKVPIVTHGYDFFQPSPEMVRIIGVDTKIGPWIHPKMVDAGITDRALQRQVADILVKQFNKDLADLQAAHPRDFVYVNLRETLNPDTDWENEIHPTRAGFRLVSLKFTDAIYTRVHELLTERGAL